MKNLTNRSFLKLLDYTPAEMEFLLDLAAELKEKKKLIRLQPKGTTITIDDNKGIEIHMPEIMEIKTITTSDPDEDKRRK